MLKGTRVIVAHPDPMTDYSEADGEFIVVGLKSNAIGRILVEVRRPGATHTTVFYPHELERVS